MAGSIFGGRGPADILSKATSWIAALYLIFTILIGMIYKFEAEQAQRSFIEKRVEEHVLNIFLYYNFTLRINSS